MIRSNVHTHSTFCDGRNTAREMVEAAIRLGFTDIGFSSHAPAPFDPSCPGVADEAAYRAEIRRLADEYKGKIGILCGVETDTYAPVDARQYDYVIGSHHYLPVNETSAEGAIAMDSSGEELLFAIKRQYAGDAIAMLQDYFARQLAGIQTGKPTIVGHFDLPKKYNQGGAIFNEESPEYRKLALQALNNVLDVLDSYGGLLEVNTGAMCKGLRSEPYPAPFLLEHAAKRGARVIVTSDSHVTQSLNGYFAEMEALLYTLGFRRMTVLKDGKFQEVPIE